MIRNRFFILGLIVFAVGTAAAGAYLTLTNYVLSHSSSSKVEQYLYMKPGYGLKKIARQAQEMGLVEKNWHFTLAARHLGLARSIKAGEYEVPAGVTVEGLLLQLSEGKTFLRRVSVPEGYSILELEYLLKDSVGLDTSDLALPEEGSVLPETYFYSRGDNANSVVERMRQAMVHFSEAAWNNRVEDLPVKNIYEALILASIVEKETAVANERPKVAAVFLNRLKRGMRLQSDPTVIYGINRGLPLARGITRVDLKMENPFNTYRISGLPPTPIANPGKASIEAVLNPVDVPYLYFVANGEGGHAFARTLKEHNKNVRAWRQIKTARDQ